LFVSDDRSLLAAKSMFASFERTWFRHDRVSLTSAIIGLLTAACGHPACAWYGRVIAVTAR
jgi:hypothetical protein